MIQDFYSRLVNKNLPVLNADDSGAASFLRPFTTDEQEVYNCIVGGWEYVLAKRDRLIVESNHFMIVDAMLSPIERSALYSYRDTLRNIVESASYPELVVFSVLPVFSITPTPNAVSAWSRWKMSDTEATLATELKSITPAQAVAWVDTNVTTLATAKNVLKIMVRLLVAMRDRVFPDLQDM